MGDWVIGLASRMVAGMCGANITVAQAYIADITPPEDRSRRMGLIGMAFGLGFIVGPALAVAAQQVATWMAASEGVVAAAGLSSRPTTPFRRPRTRWSWDAVVETPDVARTVVRRVGAAPRS